MSDLSELASSEQLFRTSATSRRFDRRRHDHRVLAARWLAHLHALGLDHPLAESLPDQGTNKYLSHLRSIRRNLDAAELDVLDFGWAHVEDYCSEFAATIVHGSFTPRAVRVSAAGDDLRVSRPDSLGWGPPVVDMFDVDLPTYCELSGWTIKQAQRAAKIGWIFRLLAAMDRSRRPDVFLPLLTAAIRDIKWRRRSPPGEVRYPERHDVEASLNTLTNSNLTIVGREANFYASTFPSEILTCRSDNGATSYVFAKYEAGRFHDVNGHRSGPRYEGAVYRDLLQHLAISLPKFVGLDRDWLFIEFVRGGVRADEAIPARDSLEAAARWIGTFHRLTAQRAPGSIVRHSPGYYVSWAQRAGSLTGRWHERFGWLRSLCVEAESLLSALETAPQSVIHGEFTPHNVLVREDGVFPLDWESAAMGPGEIDLASLTDGWPDGVVSGCEREYRKARWPDGAPSSFDQVLRLARLYWHLRWFGNDDFITAKKLGRFDALRAAGERLGMTV